MDKYEYGNVTINELEEDESDCKSKVGVRGKLDLLSNIFTIMRIIVWMESAREIHISYISKHAFSIFCYLGYLNIFSYFIISLFGLLFLIPPFWKAGGVGDSHWLSRRCAARGLKTSSPSLEILKWISSGDKH